MTFSRFLLACAITLPVMLYSTSQCLAQESIRSHPRLLADSTDIAQARQWMKQYPWYRSIIEDHKAEIDSFISHRPIYVSPLKQTYQYKMYTCPTHDVELSYEYFSPFRHRCPRDTNEVFSGGKYDAAWAGWYNRELATNLMWMGILYQLYEDHRYADAGREILMQFAEMYLNYPTDNTILGPAHVFFGTLSESFWGVDMAYGYDLLYSYGGFSSADHRLLKEKLFTPLAHITQLFPESASNRQLWYNAVSAAVGFLYGDENLIHFALKGKYGFEWQLGSALPESGFWPEWSGYHFVALRGMIHLAEMGRHNGLDLYHARIAGRTIKDMFDVPFAVILPNYEFPRSKDSGGGNLLEYAPFYEVGYAVYRDTRYLALLNLTGTKRGTQIVGETSGLGRSRTPITIFNLVSDLPRDTTALYSEHSIDLKGNGFSILRNGLGSDRRYLYLDYGIMGGEHGHPDRLQIGYYARGRNWIVDPLNESYFNPNLQLWYRQTIAHNTLVIDQTSQTWANGERVFFGALPGLQIASGKSETVYPGADLTRTVLQAGDYLIDLFDVLCSEPHVLDWPLHGSGHVVLDGVALNPESSSLFGPEPRIPGYDQLKDIQSGVSDSAWSAVFKDSNNENLSLFAIGQQGTRVFTATTPPLGGFYKQMVTDRSPLPMVFSRRVTNRTRFAHLLHAHGPIARVLSFAEAATPNTYRVAHRDGLDLITVDREHASYRLLRLQNATPTLLSGFHLLTVKEDTLELLSSTNLLEQIECRWEGTVLNIETHQPLYKTRVWGPSVRTLVLNGKQTPFRREGDYVVVTSATAPFLELLVPEDSALVAGSRTTVRVRVWNPTQQTLTSTLTMTPADDWESLVRSQLDWWGGVVNLPALNKGSVQRTHLPGPYRIEKQLMMFSSNAPATVPPGQSKTIDMDLTLASDIPPTDHKLLLRFGTTSVCKTFKVQPPVTASILIPNGSVETLCVDLRNPTHLSQKVHIALTESPGWEIPGSRTKTVVLGPHTRARVNFVCRFQARWHTPQHFPVRVAIRCGGYSASIERDFYVARARKATTSPSLDGTWRGWNTSLPLTVDSANQISKILLGNQPWRGKKDFSAAIHLLYDNDYLYVGADVQDDSVVTHWNFPMMSYPWDTDCMEVVLDTRTTSSQGTDPPTPGLFRHLSLAEHRLTDFGPEQWRGGGAGGPLLPKPLLVPHAETFFQRTRHGYALICRYPMKQLGLVPPGGGTKIGFDVAFSDNDGTTYRKNQHIWAGYGQNQSWWDMGTIGILLFEP